MLVCRVLTGNYFVTNQMVRSSEVSRALACVEPGRSSRT